MQNHLRHTNWQIPPNVNFHCFEANLRSCWRAYNFQAPKLRWYQRMRSEWHDDDDDDFDDDDGDIYIMVKCLYVCNVFAYFCV